ncbi:E3 ubiquitin-protein ligase HUWE1 [Fistulifera solaris]|uniref:HECT-type E3 ubiquitin transferase n=1 Tax=Fistulifera solaris TaxID=1519565 RepID=A0A1Z5JHS1_FISSO|nr:E3 ubiquitin-protein ligase HUWE1 [Fistulifera solaris]|eukprot:GAX13555.1 E3 ubiquitin-protein ligase HUWE1 [Fistulifera solaris]
MPTILASGTGYSAQNLDDDVFQNVFDELQAINLPLAEGSLEKLVNELQPVHQRSFEQQIDLHCWIHQLNVIDAALESILVKHSRSILLVPSEDPKREYAKNVEDTQNVPKEVLSYLQVLLSFTETILRNATGKSVYQSTSILLELLAASSEDIVDGALAALQALALPPALHKQQAPEPSVHATSLHQLPLHRVVACARGWGTRALGLGLETTVLTDEQERLPPEAGEVHFKYYDPDLQEIILTGKDILVDRQFDESNKRRKVTSVKSTAELLFSCPQVPKERQFALLSDIRLAKSFHCRDSRIKAVERRLRALIIMLHSHPSQDAITNYFSAQPELCAEVVDLIRPTVSGAHVAAHPTVENLLQNVIPYKVRLLAVEALTALVLRRDGLTNGALTGTTRLSSVLIELGVGKGQYLGVLPTLIRYSLSCLHTTDVPLTSPPENESLEIGVAFLEASALTSSSVPRKVQVEQALALIDNILTLTSAVVATPAGTTALVDCGIIPTLLTTVSVDPVHTLKELGVENDVRILCMLRYVISQAVQLLEGAFVTHGNALLTFHELSGLDVVMKVLSREIEFIGVPIISYVDPDGNAEMVQVETPIRIRYSQQVLLFTLLTCLNVVFQPESTSAAMSGTTLPGGAEIRKPALKKALIAILDNVDVFGGNLVALVSAMLTEVLNSDPHCVNHVHKSGLADAYISMIVRTTESGDPSIPAVSELIMAIPNVLAALSLTEDGAKAVKSKNPFPALLRVFYHPAYAMPRSRCLLNEMTAVIGTGLDEVMRHVDRLRPQILQAITEAMNEVVMYADELRVLEDAFRHEEKNVEEMRTCLIQYVMNFSQLLEQILHNEDHCEAFVEAGGLDALLKIFPASMPCGLQLLSHVSGMSSPSLGTLHHSKLEEALSVTLKSLYVRYDTLKLVRKIGAVAKSYLDDFNRCRQTLSSDLGCSAIESFPQEPYLVGKEPLPLDQARHLSNYLRHVAQIQWITNIVAMAIKAASQRSQDMTGWSRSEREWKKEISSSYFENVLSRLAEFHRLALFEVCRVRTEEWFETNEVQRLTRRVKSRRYKLRIVCPEGAVLRDGMEIDSCANVGNLEMGEVVVAYDRCINSSGIMRYRTIRGWVSEMTRGHGREPIAEVLSIWDSDSSFDGECDDKEKALTEPQRRVEAGVPDLKTVAVGVLARGQAGYAELFSSLSRLVTQGIRTLQVRAVSFDEGTVGAHIAWTTGILAENVNMALSLPAVLNFVRDKDGTLEISSGGVAMYFSCIVNHIYACLFEDRRERRAINFPLLVNLIASCDSSTTNDDTQLSMFDAIRFVFDHGFSDFAVKRKVIEENPSGEKRLVSRNVAASFPPVLTLLRKLISTPVSSSPGASIMSRMNWKDAATLIRVGDLDRFQPEGSVSSPFFRPESVVRFLQFSISTIVKGCWLDDRICQTPSFITHPLTGLVGDILICLEDAAKKNAPVDQQDQPHSNRRSVSSEIVHMRNDEVTATEEEEIFEASEEAINRLMEMGFTRDHALDAIESIRSNRVDLAMEYALSNFPPSPRTVERRRAERLELAQALPDSHRTDRVEAERGDRTSEDDVPESLDKLDLETTTSKPPCKDVEWERINDSLTSWVDDIPQVACNLLHGSRSSVDIIGKATGDGEGEAITVVVTSFLLDFCHKYPEKRDLVLNSVFGDLCGKISLKEGTDMSPHRIDKDDESCVASLCHATVLFIRALPRTRLSVLKFNIVSDLVACLSVYLESRDPSVRSSPAWMTPSLLLLDIMAQPSAVLTEDQSEDGGAEVESDFHRVYKDHSDRLAALSCTADAVFSLINGHEGSRDAQNSSSSNNHERSDADPEKADKGRSATRKVSLASLPVFFPLLPSSLLQSCVAICRRLLVDFPQDNALSPGLAQAGLLLLLRLCHFSNISAQFLRCGIVEAILNLPQEARFTGNSGLVTLVLRRLMEDETSLQMTMENEIRASIAKLSKKSNTGQKSFSLRSLLDTVTPLLYRDPDLFLKALALCVEVDYEQGESGPVRIRMIEGKTRRSRVDSLAAAEKADKEELVVGTDIHSNKESSPSKIKMLPAKSSKRNSVSKKTPQKEKSDHKQVHVSKDTPTSCIVCLVIDSVIEMAVDESTLFSKNENTTFLWAADLLQILADLILAIPTCVSVVYNYKLNRSKKIAVQLVHALDGCLVPSKSFVSFILHKLLPQDRWAIRNDHELWNRKKDDKVESPLIKEKKARAFRVLKISQTASRVLAALVARPGEGRKRVVADLVFCLSGGRLGHGPMPPTKTLGSTTCATSELSALQAWGELCLGFAAPRSNGRNLEGSASLSLETIRVMLDNGMAHALLYALKRVNLSHPMASSTCSMLLHPFEILTRPAVTSALNELVKRESMSGEESKITPSENMNSEEQADVLPIRDYIPEVNDSGHFDVMIDGSELVENNATDHMDEDGEQSVDNDDVEEESSSIESSNSSATDESDDSGMEEDEDEEEEEEDDDEDDEEEELSEMDESSRDGSNAIDYEEQWAIDYGENYNGGNENDGHEMGYDEVDGGGAEGIEHELEDGWTRIDSTGFGGMLMGSRVARRSSDSRQGGAIDATEAMIGTLLRDTDISAEALAEIEGSLGIRIMTGSRSLRTAIANGARIRVVDEAQSSSLERRNDLTGTLPHVHQRSRPEVGYSAFGRGGHWGEASSMEYIYGGPSVTSGSRNYDLVQSQEPHDEANANVLINLTQLDLQLFPGGPASATNARTQLSLHPLLCGVELPPINSLVSDLLPHGVRATRRGQMATRRAGDWFNASFPSGGYLVSTSNGNIVRSSRTNLGNPFSGMGDRNIERPIGWTDDGLPLDATAHEFSSVFERALREASDESRRLQQQTATTNLLEVGMDTNSTERVRGPDSLPANSHHEVDLQNNIGANDHESVNSEGDRVASSLEAGLRLSPHDEEIARLVERPSIYSESAGREGDDDAHTESMEYDPEEDTINARAVEESSLLVADATADTNTVETDRTIPVHAENSNGLVCPPGFDPEVFNSLPVEMQHDCVSQYNATQELEMELRESTLDPSVLAELPEDIRRDIIEQDRIERERARQQNEGDGAADPSHAEEMDTASFIASLAPGLREEVLLTADNSVLSSLPPDVVAEAQVLRERASGLRDGRLFAESVDETQQGNAVGVDGTVSSRLAVTGRGTVTEMPGQKKRQRTGKFKVEKDLDDTVYLPNSLFSPVCKSDVQLFIKLFFLVSPIRPQRLMQKVLQNFCSIPTLREFFLNAFLALLNENSVRISAALEKFGLTYLPSDQWRRAMDDEFRDLSIFPPETLLGATPDALEAESFNASMTASLLRHRYGFGNTTSVAANLPSVLQFNDTTLPPIVVTRLLEMVTQLCKNSPRFCLETLSPSGEPAEKTPLEQLIGLLRKQVILKSSTNLELLLSILECAVSPFSHIARLPDEETDIPQRDLDAAEASGKVYVDIPRVDIPPSYLLLLCSILRMESCRDSAFGKVNTIVRRLCRVDSNRGYILSELASIAHGLGIDALRDLRSLKIRMEATLTHKKPQESTSADFQREESNQDTGVFNSVTLSTSTNELKLLRVLQTLQALCSDGTDENSRKGENALFVTDELVHLLRQMEFSGLWAELSGCLTDIQLLEGVKSFEDLADIARQDNENNDENGNKAKQLRNSAAGLLTRFLPSVEAFFVANASVTRPAEIEDAEGHFEKQEIHVKDLVEGETVLLFVSRHKVLLNALVRNNPGLLDKALKCLVQVPRCRVFLDFDVKRQWFRSQVRRLRQQVSRRHGHQSLRLGIRRKYVFEDAYHQLRLRNAEEMRGRLHITFRDEEGIDAGGLSREFFAILAKEIFNPNYALFTATEDGCTFQPNPNSSINPDHLSYFRFVGRIVGKAVVDGFLLDAHFTRSLYKHMLGVEPTHEDMEAIDPDYYRNLKTILEYPLEDIGLDLTFSIEDHSFGRSQVIDLIPNGRKTPVVDENKEKYVKLVCQHRMTTAIKNQIKAYLDGFYELVSPELIAIFTPRELELLISGMPDIDVDDLKANTDYVGWKATDEQIEWFWKIMFSLSRNEKAAFLQFVTGSSKVPLAGFAELQGMRGIQKFSIHKASGTKGALMSAHTCFNSLDLPVYESEDEMRTKFSYAINEGGSAFLFA